jgi:hypothetical protein
VDELFELNGELPLESQREIRTVTFELHQSRLKPRICLSQTHMCVDE